MDQFFIFYCDLTAVIFLDLTIRLPDLTAVIVLDLTIRLPGHRRRDINIQVLWLFQ